MQALQQSGHQSGLTRGGAIGVGTDWCTHTDICLSVCAQPCATPSHSHSCVSFLQISSSTSIHRAPRDCPKPPLWYTAGKGQVPGGTAGVTGPRSLPSCTSRCQSTLLSALPGITVWLPWCTMGFACGPVTLCTTASRSTTQQVTLARPTASSTPGPQEPLPSWQAAFAVKSGFKCRHGH